MQYILLFGAETPSLDIEINDRGSQYVSKEYRNHLDIMQIQ
jgi:hypothetical protein